MNENNLSDFLNSKFHFEYNNQEHKNIIASLIKSPNLEEILDRINNVNDIVFIIINTSESKLGLLANLIRNNLDKIKDIINNSHINQKHINFIIDSCNLEILQSDKEILELGIQKGYIFNEYTLNILESDKTLLIKKINSIINLEELLDLINHLSEQTLKDNLIINLAITKGYYFTKYTPKELKSNKEILKRILANIHFKDNNNLYILETINNCDPNVLDERILNIAKNKLGYYVTINSPIERINEIYKKHYEEYLKTFNGKTKEKYIKLGQKIGQGLIYYERNNSLFNKEVVNTFGENAISKIYKYHILLDNSIGFEYLIKNNGLEKFKYLFTVLSDNNDNFKTFDTKLFLEFLNKYQMYGNLCFDYISTNGINEKSKKVLKTLLSNKYKNIEIKNLNDLKNIGLIIKENNINVIKSDSKLEIKNIICLLLCNMTLEELNILFYSIDENNLNRLKEEMHDIKIKLLLEKYILLIKFLRYIKNCNNLEKLKLIAQKINNYDFKKIEIIQQNFIGIFENIKYFYGVEVNSKLTKLELLKTSENIFINTNEYKATNGKCVKYIDIYENAIFFQHTMNAYGRGGRLYDFKNPRLVGQTRLCLSLVSNNYEGIKRIPNSCDNVTLIFDKIEPSSLITMDFRDISSNTQINSLIVLYNKYVQFNTTYDMLHQTNKSDYNEYNVYLENMDGTFIYPSAVKVIGNKPCQEEIDAAEYLDIPLVKINQTRKAEYFQKDTIDNETKTDELNELNAIFDDLKTLEIKQYKKVHQDI